jgi:hypothetical protein
MMKYRFARLTLVLGVPAVLASACSGSSTLPPTSLETTGGSATGTGATPSFGGFNPGQGGAGNIPTVTNGGSPVGSTGGTTVSFGGYPTSTGGVNTATGGVPGNTGGVSSGGGSLNVTAGGYVQSSTYKGYAWTGTENPTKGSTITPPNFETVTTASQLCVSGSVAADASYGGVAMLGVNLNQATTGGTGSELTYTPPAGGSVTVSVTNTGGSPLRVQIQGAGGATDANQRWCATLTGTGATIALSSFNTQCWEGGAGVAYAGQPLQALMILVPGGNATATSFNFCLNSLTI